MVERWTGLLKKSWLVSENARIRAHIIDLHVYYLFTPEDLFLFWSWGGLREKVKIVQVLERYVEFEQEEEDYGYFKINNLFRG